MLSTVRRIGGNEAGTRLTEYAFGSGDKDSCTSGRLNQRFVHGAQYTLELRTFRKNKNLHVTYISSCNA